MHNIFFHLKRIKDKPIRHVSYTSHSFRKFSTAKLYVRRVDYENLPGHINPDLKKIFKKPCTQISRKTVRKSLHLNHNYFSLLFKRNM